jgi:hypothetical protein
MRKIKFAILAGEEKVFQAAGRFFFLLSNSLPVSVTFYGVAGSSNSQADDVSAGFYARLVYTSFTVKSTINQTVEVFIADDEVGSSAIAGAVSVVDADRAKVDAGQFFYGSATSFHTTAGQSLVQLYKPTSPPYYVRTAVKSIRVSCEANSIVTVSRTNGAQATSFEMKGQSAVSGGFQSLAEVRFQNSGNNVSGLALARLWVPAGGDRVIEFPGGLLVSDGGAVCVNQSATSALMYVSVQFEEAP